MPSRKNKDSEIGSYISKSDSRDIDNIFLTEQGWVYRHYKNDAMTRYYDEVLVAGEVPSMTSGVNNAPINAFDEDEMSVVWEAGGDSVPDVMYSPQWGGGGPRSISSSFGSITATLTHDVVAPSDGEDIVFTANLTFTPSEGNEDKTLDDVEDSLVFHWSHDGIQDSYVPGDGAATYSFNSSGTHNVGVSVVSNQINPNISQATDTFTVLGHIDNLIVNYTNQGDGYVSAEDVTTFTVTYDGTIEGVVKVTDVKLSDPDGFVQEGWYDITLNDNNTFQVTTMFGYDFDLEITVEHDYLATPHTEKVTGFISKVSGLNAAGYNGYYIKMKDGGHDRSVSKNWAEEDNLENLGATDRNYLWVGRNSYSGDDLVYPTELIINGFGYKDSANMIPPERVSHTTRLIPESNEFARDENTIEITSGADYANRGKKYEFVYELSSDYMHTYDGVRNFSFSAYGYSSKDNNFTSSQTIHVRTTPSNYGQNAPNSSTVPALMVHEDDNPQGQWIKRDIYEVEDRYNVVYHVPASVTKWIFNIKHHDTRMKTGYLQCHDKDSWTSTLTDPDFFTDGVYKAYLEDDANLHLNLTKFRAAGYKTVRVSTIGITDSTWMSFSHANKVNDMNSIYLILVD